ncbi:MAG TPA: TetR/AcrR family transcriptional regulator [Phenylobacterium sp.]|uniref:TetR/AcrR family transcriptional regulator n=1 Tax=Phenylobacterium sp. TaxID=1871053 RepID=UPI002B498702|nr:TetR/AcrR family transcriptional regulator [Phenylobacterium sp.]HKR88076.1 TetR/AcrR family transcriptional regulator [Phenylobacterium sp.]
MLAAARELFASQGYEAATVRQIANLAGVSVGSVFTSFASKADILSEVMKDRLEGLYAELNGVIPHLRGSTADRLRSMFAIHFAFEHRHVQLFLAHLAAAYDWTLGPGATPYGRNLRLQELLIDCLARGVAEGDVDPATDLRGVVDLLLAVYAWTYRLAAWENSSAEKMIAAMDRQIGLIAKGFAPR